MNFASIVYLILAIVFGALVLSGCAVLPEAPEGQICVLVVADDQADCLDMRPLPGSMPSLVPIEMTNGYIAFAPETWANIQSYIEALKIRLSQK